MIDVVESSIAELRAALETRAATAVDLVRAYLARIEAYDAPGTATALNAVVVPNPDALAEAEASDARRAEVGDGRLDDVEHQPPTFGCCCVMQWMPPPRAKIGRASTVTTRRPG